MWDRSKSCPRRHSCLGPAIRLLLAQAVRMMQTHGHTLNAWELRVVSGVSSHLSSKWHGEKEQTEGPVALQHLPLCVLTYSQASSPASSRNKVSPTPSAMWNAPSCPEGLHKSLPGATRRWVRKTSALVPSQPLTNKNKNETFTEALTKCQKRAWALSHLRISSTLTWTLRSNSSSQ